MFDGRTVLAVVPARGGSKGIPKKDLREVCGVSLVGRAGDLARSLRWLDACVLSTDDAEIAEEGSRRALLAAGRSGRGSGRLAWRLATRLARGRDPYGKQFDISVLLEPTSPLGEART